MRIELMTPGLQDQCSNHWAIEALMMRLGGGSSDAFSFSLSLCFFGSLSRYVFCCILWWAYWVVGRSRLMLVCYLGRGEGRAVINLLGWFCGEWNCHTQKKVKKWMGEKHRLEPLIAFQSQWESVIVLRGGGRVRGGGGVWFGGALPIGSQSCHSSGFSLEIGAMKVRWWWLVVFFCKRVNMRCLSCIP